MKVIERICEKRLRKIVELNQTQLDFKPDRGTTDANSIMKQLIEKYEWPEEINVWYLS